MIKEVKMYTVICDCCGKDACAGTDYASWNESSYVEEIAVEDGWLCDDEHHYCPECYEFDDEDNLVVKEAEPARTTTKEQSIIANVSVSVCQSPQHQAMLIGLVDRCQDFGVVE